MVFLTVQARNPLLLISFTAGIAAGAGGSSVRPRDNVGLFPAVRWETMEIILGNATSAKLHFRVGDAYSRAASQTAVAEAENDVIFHTKLR